MRSDIVLVTSIIALAAVAIVRMLVAPDDSTAIIIVVGIIGAIAGVSGTMVAPRVASFLHRRVYR